MKRPAALLLAAAAVASITVGAMARDAAPAPRIERVAAFDGAMPTGVTVAPNGRIFVNFPQWGDQAPFTVAELVDGKAVPYPDAATNRPNPADPAGHFISVQSVVADGANRLWVLDTAAPKFAPPQAGGAKLVAIDLATNRVVKTIVLPPSVVLPTTYLNDVRFDLRQGEQGTAYITDSSNAGVGGIIVVDIASGRAIRRLSGHATTNPEPGFTPVVDGEVLMNRPASGPATPVAIASDAIALSADGSMLYYGPLSGRTLHAVPTAMLRDPSVSEEALAVRFAAWGAKARRMALPRTIGGASSPVTMNIMRSGCSIAAIGRPWSAIRASAGLIPCRSAPMAISISPRTSFTASPAFMAAVTCVASRMNYSASRSVAGRCC